MLVKRYRKQAKVVVKRVLRERMFTSGQFPDWDWEYFQVLPIISASDIYKRDKELIDEYCSNTDCGICTNRICEIPNPPTTVKELLDYRLTLRLMRKTNIDNCPMHDKADDIVNEKNSK